MENDQRLTKVKGEEKCAACRKPPVDGCSRSECPCRRTISAAPSGDFNFDGCGRAEPVNYEEEKDELDFD